MIKRKSKFLNFWISMIPGAGQMYLGFMKQGISLLTLCCVLTLLSIWLEFGGLMILFPIIWFYSFFDSINKNSLCDEDFYALEDDYCFHMDEISSSMNHLLQGKYKLIAAALLIFIGADMLLNNFNYYLTALLGWEIASRFQIYTDRLPQLVFSIVIILIGLYLIKGKKEELKLIEDKEGYHENS